MNNNEYISNKLAIVFTLSVSAMIVTFFMYNAIWNGMMIGTIFSAMNFLWFGSIIGMGMTGAKYFINTKNKVNMDITYINARTLFGFMVTAFGYFTIFKVFSLEQSEIYMYGYLVVVIILYYVMVSHRLSTRIIIVSNILSIIAAFFIVRYINHELMLAISVVAIILFTAILFAINAMKKKGIDGDYKLLTINAYALIGLHVVIAALAILGRKEGLLLAGIYPVLLGFSQIIKKV